MRFASTLVLALLASTGTAMADFQLSISSWGNIPLCTSGRPNTVGNPQFTLRDIPEGTTRLDFEMVDLDVPGYDHGGGRVRVGGGGDGVIPAGTFTYRSPCPPGGTHTYEWTVTARSGSGVLATASTRLRYPQ